MPTAHFLRLLSKASKNFGSSISHPSAIYSLVCVYIMYACIYINLYINLCLIVCSQNNFICLSLLQANPVQCRIGCPAKRGLRAWWRGRVAFHLSGSFHFPQRLLLMVGGCLGDFPHLNSGRDLQIFDAHIFRCCFVLLIGAVPALWAPLLPLLLLLLLLLSLLLFLLLFLAVWLASPLFSSATLRYIVKDFDGI